MKFVRFLRAVARLGWRVWALWVFVLASALGAGEPESVRYGLRLSEIGSWPKRAVEAWKYENPYLKWKAFLVWENEGEWLAIDKEAHFACCYGGILTGEMLEISARKSVAVVSTAALLNELVEWKLGFWIPPEYRGISVKDIIVDAGGIVVGLLVVKYFQRGN